MDLWVGTPDSSISSLFNLGSVAGPRSASVAPYAQQEHAGEVFYVVVISTRKLHRKTPVLVCMLEAFGIPYQSNSLGLFTLSKTFEFTP